MSMIIKKKLKIRTCEYEIFYSLALFFSIIIFYKVFLHKPYYGLFIDLFDEFRFILALIVFSIFSVLYFKKDFLNNFFKKLIIIFFVFILIPSLGIFVFTPDSYFFLLTTVCSLIIIILVASFSNLDFFFFQNIIQVPQKIIFEILLFINLLYFIFTLINTDFGLITLEIDNFSVNRDLLDHGKITIYANSIITTTLLPICFVFSLYLKRFFFSVILFSLFLIYGLILSVKILILMPFGILIFFVFYDNKNFIYLVLFLITGCLLLFSIEILNSYFNGFAVPETLFANYIGRRLVIIPSFNNYIYLLEYNSKLSINVL